MKQILIFLIFLQTASLNPDVSNSLNPLPKDNEKVNYKIHIKNGEITYESNINQQSYSYGLKTSDGTIKKEGGHFEENNFIAEGSYEYIGDNGLLYKVIYVADKYGYRPKVYFGSRTGPIVTTISHTTTTTTRRPITTSPRPQCYPGSTDPRCPQPLRPPTTTSRPQCYPGSTDPRCPPAPSPATTPGRPPCYPGSTDPRCPIPRPTILDEPVTRIPNKKNRKSGFVDKDARDSAAGGGTEKRSINT